MRDRIRAGAIAAAALLLLVSLLLTSFMHVLVAVVGAAIAAIIIGLAWQRDLATNRDRLAQLDRIVAEVRSREKRTNEGAALSQLRDIERSLHELCVRVGARRVILWEVDAGSEHARPWAASGGPLPLSPVPLRGSPLGWTWEEGMQIRLEPPPAWATADAQVCAARLRRSDDEGALISYEFAANAQLPPAEVLDGAASYLRATLAAQNETTRAAGDRERLGLLLRALRQIPMEMELDAFARELVVVTQDLVDATGGALALWEEERGRVIAVCGSDGGPTPGTVFNVLESELAMAARAGSTILREDRGRAAAPVAALAEKWTSTPRSLAAVPLATPQGIVGVLALWSSERPRIDTDALEMVQTLAPYAALLLTNAREFGRMRERAERDALTGLRNRRAFDSELAAERARFERYGRPLSLMILDLDLFKNINDTHGHEAGDAALQAVAAIVEKEIRDVDIAARMGGEEFVVLLPETVLSHATEVAERLRAAIERTDFQWRGTRVPLRASLGVSACPTCVADPRALLRSADAALYQAKALGRNRVVCAERKP